MKELKAVEILSRIKKTPQDIFRYSDRDFDDALSELQELTQEKNCRECKHLLAMKGYSTSHIWCNLFPFLQFNMFCQMQDGPSNFYRTFSFLFRSRLLLTRDRRSDPTFVPDYFPVEQ